MKLKSLSIATLALISMLNCNALMGPSGAEKCIASDQKINYVASTNFGIPNFIEKQKAMCEENKCKELFDKQSSEIMKMGGFVAVLSRGKSLYEEHEGEKVEEDASSSVESLAKLYQDGFDFITSKGYEGHFAEELELLIALRDICAKKNSEERSVALGKALNDIIRFEDLMKFRFSMRIAQVFQFSFIKYAFALLDIQEIFDIDPIDPKDEHIRDQAKELASRMQILQLELLGL